MVIRKWVDGKAGRFYVKIYPKTENRGLINEITGFLLAHANGLPQPQKAAVIQLPIEIIPPEELNKFDVIENTILGWATEECGITPNTYLKVNDVIKYNQSLEMLKSWTFFPRLLAFDDWVANQDRNTGNITIKGNKDFHLIDHGNVPVSENWNIDDLIVDKHYNNKLLDGLYEKNYPLPLSSSMINESKEHCHAFEHIKNELNKWWQVLLDEDSYQNIMNFINIRSQRSPSRIQARTGLVI